MKTTIWHGCYDGQLKGLITPAAFAHPAKMSRALAERIFEHGCALGYWQPGDTIVDPFFGIGVVGLVGAYRGYRVIGVELEPRFVEMAQANIDRNQSKLMRLGKPSPMVLQGDSRNLRGLISDCSFDGVVSSPPYAGSNINPGNVGREIENLWGSGASLSAGHPDGYGTSKWQIGAMRVGDVDAVVTSPPYADGLGHGGMATEIDKQKKLYIREAEVGNAYGVADGQIGAENGEMYWQAMAQVYGQMFLLIKPGGVAAIVVKDYVKNRQRVPLCDQTVRLLEAVGFEVVERCQAMLVKEHGTMTDMFTAQKVTRRTERKSFFRRLAEKNGSPRIDYEEVIWAVKRDCHAVYDGSQ